MKRSNSSSMKFTPGPGASTATPADAIAAALDCAMQEIAGALTDASAAAGATSFGESPKPSTPATSTPAPPPAKPSKLTYVIPETLPYTLSLAAQHNLYQMGGEEAWRMLGAGVLVLPGREPVELPFGDYLICRWWAEPRDDGANTHIVAIAKPA